MSEQQTVVRRLKSSSDLLALIKSMPNGNASFDFSKGATYPFDVRVAVKGDNWRIECV